VVPTLGRRRSPATALAATISRNPISIEMSLFRVQLQSTVLAPRLCLFSPRTFCMLDSGS
jgi:hypothetical protein